jgi:hypothetical protein
MCFGVEGTPYPSMYQRLDFPLIKAVLSKIRSLLRKGFKDDSSRLSQAP